MTIKVIMLTVGLLTWPCYCLYVYKDMFVFSRRIKQHIPTINGEIPEQKQDLPRPHPQTTVKEEFFKMDMYRDIDSYILKVNQTQRSMI